MGYRFPGALQRERPRSGEATPRDECWSQELDRAGVTDLLLFLVRVFLQSLGHLNVPQHLQEEEEGQAPPTFPTE